MAKNNNRKIIKAIAIVFIFYYVFSVAINGILSNIGSEISDFSNNKKFRIIASTSVEKMEETIKKYAKKEGMDLIIDYFGDIEIVKKLNENSKNYDAVWISNSLWLYMLDNSYLTTDSKSIVIDPVVMGITKSKAEKLGFVNKEIYNKDLLNAIQNGKLKYIMASVTKTNTGATSYLSFLNTLAGSPEVLTEEMLQNEGLKKDLKDLFRGVERVSGDENYLETMFKNGNYDAMINYESSLIKINKELIKSGKEPLYLLYPIDGVAINDMPFAYINNNSNDTKKHEQFLKLQTYLRSDEVLKLMESYGYRSWYGGINKNADTNVFNPSWGIDTTKYLKDMKYPSKSVITKAINLYIDVLRKPTHVVFCLDVSGSMQGSGLADLKNAMYYILDYESASQDNLQFSATDKITIIPFNGDVVEVSKTYNGNNTSDAILKINDLVANGSTNIYDPSIEALKVLHETDSSEYTKTVILMTDGQSNRGSFQNLKNYYEQYNSEKIPIYSITFGNARVSELEDLAKLSNGRVFNGENGLKEAFAEVRSYN